MKKNLFIVTTLCLLSFIPAAAQQCQGENPITMVLKGYKKDYRFIAQNATFLLNANDGNFNFNISLEKFKTIDSIDAQTFLKEVLEEDFFTNLSFTAILPVSNIDKETDRMQKFNVSGNLVLGDIRKQIPLELELEYMDRDLMFDFVLTLTPKDLEIAFPDKYKSILTGVIQLRTDAGKLVVSP
ncbi:MAG TPA: hypothetical protein VNB90_16265 [Cytophagaceae bacterium]|jgi:hypothetical protein|nr:hypothetical protein [Cytophagaceae bacterium]